jgi:hypothetical protein
VVHEAEAEVGPRTVQAIATREQGAQWQRSGAGEVETIMVEGV